MDKDNKEYFRGVITGIFGGIAVVIIVMLLWNIKGKTLSGNITSGELDNTYGKGSEEKISTIQQYIDTYYMDDVEKNKVLDGMYSGMMESLQDPYSVYYTSDEYKELLESTNGQYSGIGVMISTDPDTNIITIIRVFSGSPAEQAGAQIGDILSAIDGVGIENDDTSEVVSKIKGKDGTQVKITVIRNNTPIDLVVTRQKVNVDTVTYHMMDNNIGWLYISEFDGVTGNQVKDAIENLKAQGMQKLIVDLRDNPGGRLDIVTQVLDYFLPKDQLLLYTENKAGKKEEYYSENDGILTDMPMCVIVNGNSASASEVFTGAIKCYKRGTIVGTKTFGKGIVQSVFNLDDGSALKITTGKYYLPDGTNIHKQGIEPDYTVDLPDGVMSPWTLQEQDDVQLNKAIEILNGQ